MRNNERDNITGYLLRKNNTYLNVVEGAHDKVDEMLSRVARDSRAFGFQILSFTHMSERQYPAWSMGYDERNKAQLSQCPISAFLKQPRPDGVEPVLKAMQTLGLRQIELDQRAAELQTYYRQSA